MDVLKISIDSDPVLLFIDMARGGQRSILSKETITIKKAVGQIWNHLKHS